MFNSKLTKEQGVELNRTVLEPITAEYYARVKGPIEVWNKLIMLDMIDMEQYENGPRG